MYMCTCHMATGTLGFQGLSLSTLMVRVAEPHGRTARTAPEVIGLWQGLLQVASITLGCASVYRVGMVFKPKCLENTSAVLQGNVQLASIYTEESIRNPCGLSSLFWHLKYCLLENLVSGRKICRMTERQCLSRRTLHCGDMRLRTTMRKVLLDSQTLIELFNAIRGSFQQRVLLRSRSFATKSLKPLFA